MQGMMKAVRIYEPGKFGVDQIEIPKLKRGEVLVKIWSVAICGSDPGIFDGKVLSNGWPPYFPFVAGHEFSGQVVELGEDVDGFRVGDRVAGEAHCGCGRCAMCREGRYNLCLNYGKEGSGHHHYGHNTPGCYAQYQAYDQKVLTRLPGGLSYDEGTMADTGGTAFNALRLTGVVPGGWTAVVGPGPMGMMAMLLSRAMGSRTIMVGRGQRLEMAQRLGADATVNFERTPDVVAAVRALSDGQGAHQVIEAAGNASAYFQSVQMSRRGGHAALISIPPEDGQKAAVKSLIMNQITLHGVRANPNCSASVLELMAAGRVDVKPLLTHAFGIDDIQEAFDAFTSRRDGAMKVIVHPNGNGG